MYGPSKTFCIHWPKLFVIHFCTCKGGYSLMFSPLLFSTMWSRNLNIYHCINVNNRCFLNCICMLVPIARLVVTVIFKVIVVVVLISNSIHFKSISMTTFLLLAVFFCKIKMQSYLQCKSVFSLHYKRLSDSHKNKVIRSQMRTVFCFPK